MKKAAKFLMPLVLGLLILSSIVWYLFIYDRDFTRDTLLNQARYQDMSGNSRLSSWFYDAVMTKTLPLSWPTSTSMTATTPRQSLP